MRSRNSCSSDDKRVRPAALRRAVPETPAHLPAATDRARNSVGAATIGTDPCRPHGNGEGSFSVGLPFGFAVFFRNTSSNPPKIATIGALPQSSMNVGAMAQAARRGSLEVMTFSPVDCVRAPAVAERDHFGETRNGSRGREQGRSVRDDRTRRVDAGRYDVWGCDR